MGTVNKLLVELHDEFPDWSIQFEYGYWRAQHDNFDASWEGPEDGWVSNPNHTCSARDLPGLREEILEAEENLRSTNNA